MVHLQPEPGGGEEEAHHLRPSVIKNAGAPASMLSLPGIRIFIAAGAVKLVKALLVLAEMGGYPVQDHRDAVCVHMVHEPHEILRRAEPGGGGKVSGALVAPGVIQGMLCHRQQFHGGVAHVLHVGRQLAGHIPVVQKIAVFMLPPGAQVHLIDVQRLVVHRLLGFPEGLIRPRKMLDVIKLAGGAGAGLRVEAVGVRLVAESAVRAGDGVFIAGVDRQIRHKALPELPLGGQGRFLRVPAVEVPHHGDGLGPGGPDVEPPAVDALFRGGMGAEEPPAVRQTAAVIQLCPVRHGIPPVCRPDALRVSP